MIHMTRGHASGCPRKAGMTVVIGILLFANNTAFADTPPQPVEISAAKSIEWNRAAKTYTAREKVIVTQGAATIHSDTLTARYDDTSGMTNITTLEANSNVIISSPPYTAYGDKAVYNVKTGNAVLTGKDLKITTDADTLTARDKVEFFGNENRLSAVGGATAVHENKTLTADSMDAYFTKDSAGKMAATKITAAGHVTIKTAKETATGDAGVYNVPAQKAVLTGKVRIRQGENWLEGTRANVDMTTGISQLLGDGNVGTSGAETGGRVRGTFYPKSESPKK